MHRFPLSKCPSQLLNLFKTGSRPLGTLKLKPVFEQGSRRFLGSQTVLASVKSSEELLSMVCKQLASHDPKAFRFLDHTNTGKTEVLSFRT